MHAYQLHGYNVIVDEQSGSVHQVDDLAYFLINRYQNTSRPELLRAARFAFPNEALSEIEDCIDDIESLEKAGKLFSNDAYDIELARKISRKKPVVKALCLHVAHTCNLNCSYCFAAQGKYHGDRGLMKFEVAKRSIDFLIENSGSRRNLEVDFFGGEPLMNWQLVKDTVAYARSIEKAHNKNFRFTLTTNGIGINDEVIEFANREMHNVVLSLDGRACVHDNLRKDYSGRGSYDRIVPKFQELVRRRGGKNYYIRGTYTHFNVDFMNDIRHMLDLGFRELSLEPVVCDPSDPYALTEEDLPILFRQYEELAQCYLDYFDKGDPFSFYHYNLDLHCGPCIYKRIAGCGSGCEYFAVTPWGELYPCHQFVGEGVYSMGDIWSGVKNHAAQAEFQSCNVYSHEECADCWARLYCSGGCAANAYHASGKINGIYAYGCELFKKRMECALMIQVALEERRQQALEVAPTFALKVPATVCTGCDY
ncbi:MAG: thioether cross-link-forming SCIFF peptide maturase [Eubacteriales bacterium]|nr:thioether cross-link-forming SCIFF peptide maturase [Eubacteriales bacterium]